MDLYIDIETIPTQSLSIKDLLSRKISAPSNYKDEAKIADYIALESEKVLSRTALQPEGEIVCIGMAFDDEPIITLTRHDSDSDSEKRLLQQWLEIVKDSTSIIGRPAYPRIIGHNGIGFDIPRLFQRCIVHELLPPAFWPPPWDLSRWKCHSGRVLDTMYAFSQSPLVSLDMMAEILGIETNYPLHDGKIVTATDVYALWKAGKDSVIATYCSEDVRVLREIAERLK